MSRVFSYIEFFTSPSLYLHSRIEPFANFVQLHISVSVYSRPTLSKKSVAAVHHHAGRSLSTVGGHTVANQPPPTTVLSFTSILPPGTV